MFDDSGDAGGEKTLEDKFFEYEVHGCISTHVSACCFRIKTSYFHSVIILGSIESGLFHAAVPFRHVLFLHQAKRTGNAEHCLDS